MADQEKLNGELEQEALEATPEESAPAEDKAPVAKKSDKPVKKQQRPGFFARVGKWFRDLRAEAKKVIWPTRKQVVNNTIVVIVMVIVVAAFVAILDTAFGQVRDFLARLLA